MFATVSFPHGSVVKKNPSANAGYTGSILGWKDLLEKEVATHARNLARGNLMDRGPLRAIGPWDCKEMDTT